MFMVATMVATVVAKSLTSSARSSYLTCSENPGTTWRRFILTCSYMAAKATLAPYQIPATTTHWRSSTTMISQR